jgi:hypothetical protein
MTGAAVNDARSGSSLRPRIIYNIIERAKLNGFDPEAHLPNLIVCITERPAKRIGELLI